MIRVARGAGPHLRDRRRRLLRRVDVPPLRRVRPPRPRRAGDERPRRARRGQAPPGRLRAVEADAARRRAAAGVGLAVGPRVPGLAHRVLGDGDEVPRRPLRHPHRRHRPRARSTTPTRWRRASACSTCTRGWARGCTTSSSTWAARRSPSRRGTCSSSTRSSSAASTRSRSATSSSRRTTASSRRSAGRRWRRPPPRYRRLVGQGGRRARGRRRRPTRRASSPYLRRFWSALGRRPQRAPGAGRRVGGRARSDALSPADRWAFLDDADRALGFGLADAEAPDADESGSDPRIDALVAERQAARAAKDFATSRPHPRRAGRRGHRPRRHPDRPHLAPPLSRVRRALVTER